MQTQRLPSPLWLLAVIAAGSVLIAFYPGLTKLTSVWFGRPEYSHGVLIPLIALFLVWQRRDELRSTRFEGSWAGVTLVLAGALLGVLGNLATLYVIQLYGFLFALYGVVLALVGWRVLRMLWAPLFILLLMIPLPEFLLNNFSSQLQLISSQIGVAFIRLFGISVFLEGNVIDLGSLKLQVAEACSGLRYLFPLLTLGFIMACFFKAALWKRIALFLSSIPITILMNSLRIGLIGVSVEYWGVAMAEGFLHDFEGWVVFMASAAVLVLEIMLLTRLGKDARPWREVFGIELPAPLPAGRKRVARPVPKPFIAASCALAAFALAFSLLPARAESYPRRASFAEFPVQIGAWQGRREALESIYLDTLKLDDYVFANYARPNAGPVNFYTAWYDSQRAGQSAHSPRSCLPGGGWRIRSLERIELPGAYLGSQPLHANRVLIELGDQKQVIYYWFQQRGRIITSEYLVKWYIFWDALTRNRTDGALVRLGVPVPPGSDALEADEALQDFTRTVAPLLPHYVPD